MELQEENDDYNRRRKECKAALVRRYAPDLIGRSWELTTPDVKDEDSIQNYLERVEELQNLAMSVPDEQFQMDYHLYHISIPECGEYSLEIERNYAVMMSTYSAMHGKRKCMEQINKDIFTFYGVSEQDIMEKSERYSLLVTTFAT